MTGGHIVGDETKKINPDAKFILSLVFHHHTARENGKTTRVATDARDCVPRHRARESARDAIFVFFLASSIGGLFSRATWTDPPHFCALFGRRIFIIINKHTQNQRKEKKQKKRPTKRASKAKERYLLDGWIFQRFRRFRARAFRLRGIRSRRLGDDFRGGGSNGVHDFRFSIAFL